MTFLELLDAEIAAQERLLEAHPAYVKLKALRITRAAYVGSADVGSMLGPAASLAAAHAPRKPAPSTGRSLDAVSAVVDILAEAGRPMRTSELMELIAQRGIHFNAAAPQNVLSSLLSRSDDVVSKGGHIGWALTKWESAGGSSSDYKVPPTEKDTPAEGREAGPGGGT